MSSLRLQARLYIAALALAALGLMAFTLPRLGSFEPGRLLMVISFIGLMTAAVLFPLQLAFKTKLALDTTVLFAAVLLFKPGVAMVIAFGGILLSHAFRRRDWIEALVNGSQTALQVGIAGLILSSAGWQTDRLSFADPKHILAILMAAVAMHLVNTFLVATMIALQSGHPLPLVWRQVFIFDAVEHLSQLALGLLAAAVIDTHSWALPFFLLPAFAVYRSSERHLQLRRQTLDAVESLADIVDIRDPYTANHSSRVATFARELAISLGLTPDEVDLVERAARVHDVGKIVVDITVLTKEGKLTFEEWEQLKQHPATGADILSRFLQFALATSYVRHHHERIDGKGYPDSLSGEQIPLGARIIAVADSFDAMSSDRPYRAAMPLPQVLEELRRGRGTQWDERVVDAMLKLVEREQVSVAEPTRVTPARATA